MPFVCERLIMSGMLCPSRGKQSTMTTLAQTFATSVNSASTVLIISYTIYGNAKLFTRSALALFVILLQMSVLHCLVNFLFCVSTCCPRGRMGKRDQAQQINLQLTEWHVDLLYNYVEEEVRITF